MIWLQLTLLFLVGVLLSAFFSGTETGFYRVTRVRLALDALEGDVISRCLLWLTNNPALFVATSLIGNNLANYITTLAVVLGARNLFSGDHHTAELLAPIVLAPVVFVYGELLPKNLFYLAPNQLLRRSGPLFLVCGLLFAPVSLILWTLGRCLQWLVGEAPEQVRLRLAREELQHILDEGQEAGVLRPAQRQLAQGMFSVANRPVLHFCVPSARFTTVRRNTSKAEVLRIARRQRSPFVLVMPAHGGQPDGYVRIIDLHLNEQDWLDSIRPLLPIDHTASHIAALIRMQTEKEPVAQAVDDQGKSVGIIDVRRLTEPLLGR